MSIFSRTATNYVLQIIKLAKHARIELEKGKTKHAIKLLKIILKKDQKQLDIVEHETGSRELQQEIDHIHHMTVSALTNVQDTQNILKIINRIIELEMHEILIKTKKFDELKKEIKKEKIDIDRIGDALGKGIDKMIKPLIATLTYKGFKTMASCHGHNDRGLSTPWVDIEDHKNISKLFQLLHTYKTTHPIKWTFFEFARPQYQIVIMRLKRDGRLSSTEIHEVRTIIEHSAKQHNAPFKYYNQYNDHIIAAAVPGGKYHKSLEIIYKELLEKHLKGLEIQFIKPDNKPNRFRIQSKGASLKHMQQDIIHFSDYLLRNLN